MNKVLSYSKIAGIVAAFLFVASLAGLFISANLSNVITGLGLKALKVLLAVFFFLLYNSFGKESSISKPAILYLIGFSLYLFAIISSSIAFDIIPSFETESIELASLFKLIH